MCKLGKIHQVTLALFLTLLYFVMGLFGFINLFDIRRETQVVCLSIFAFLLLPALRRGTYGLRFSLVWILALLAVFAVARAQYTFETASIALSAYFAFGLVCLDNASRERVNQGLVIGASLFSAMGLFQGLLFVINPDLFHGIEPPFSSRTQDEIVLVSRTIEYLGFASSGSYIFLGREFPRFYSFSSEPSALVVPLMVPGFLGLLLPSRLFQLLGGISLAFVITLPQSGTIWLSGLAGLMFYTVCQYMPTRFRRNTRLFCFTVLTAGGLGFLALSGMDTVGTVSGLTGLLGGAEQISSVAAGKEGSATVRLDTIRDSASLALMNPFGVAEGYIGVARGFCMNLGLVMGYIGLLAGLVLLYEMTFRCHRLFQTHSTLTVRIGACGLWGVLTQMALFSDYGWLTVPGFVALTLLLDLRPFTLETTLQKTKVSAMPTLALASQPVDAWIQTGLTQPR
jgi:hypothetical protein